MLCFWIVEAGGLYCVSPHLLDRYYSRMWRATPEISFFLCAAGDREFAAVSVWLQNSKLIMSPQTGGFSVSIIARHQTDGKCFAITVIFWTLLLAHSFSVEVSLLSLEFRDNVNLTLETLRLNNIMLNISYNDVLSTTTTWSRSYSSKLAASAVFWSRNKRGGSIER